MIIHFIVSSLPFSTHHYVALVCLHSHYPYLCLKEGCKWDLVGFYFQVPAGPIFRLYFFSESKYFIFLNFTVFQGQQDLCPLVVVASGYPVSLRKDLLDCNNGFWLRKKALSSFPTLHDHSFHRVFFAFPNLHTLCCTCVLFTQSAHPLLHLCPLYTYLVPWHFSVSSFWLLWALQACLFGHRLSTLKSAQYGNLEINLEIILCQIEWTASTDRE